MTGLLEPCEHRCKHPANPESQLPGEVMSLTAATRAHRAPAPLTCRSVSFGAAVSQGLRCRRNDGWPSSARRETPPRLRRNDSAHEGQLGPPLWTGQHVVMLANAVIVVAGDSESFTVYSEIKEKNRDGSRCHGPFLVAMLFGRVRSNARLGRVIAT